MKAITQITITEGGREVRDTASDVISLEYMKLIRENEKVPIEAYPVLTTEYMLKRMIDLSSYKTRSEMKRADDIYQKIRVTDGKILLSDGEYEFLNNIREGFKPYLSGRLFEPFHVVMESAETLPDTL